jgi:hypothetical protein
MKPGGKSGGSQGSRGKGSERKWETTEAIYSMWDIIWDMYCLQQNMRHLFEGLGVRVYIIWGVISGRPWKGCRLQHLLERFASTRTFPWHLDPSHRRFSIDGSGFWAGHKGFWTSVSGFESLPTQERLCCSMQGQYFSLITSYAVTGNASSSGFPQHSVVDVADVSLE